MARNEALLYQAGMHVVAEDGSDIDMPFNSAEARLSHNLFKIGMDMLKKHGVYFGYGESWQLPNKIPVHLDGQTRPFFLSAPGQLLEEIEMIKFSGVDPYSYLEVTDGFAVKVSVVQGKGTTTEGIERKQATLEEIQDYISDAAAAEIAVRS